MATQLIMPEMGEGVIEGTVARWLKAEGEHINRYEPVLEIETDKVTTEATAEEAGTLLKILVPEGKTVPVGTVLAVIGQPGEALPAGGKSNGTAVLPPQPPPIETPVTRSPVHPLTPSAYTGRISPVVGRIAAENDVNLNWVTGTGRDGRITKKDILAYVETVNRQTSSVIRQPETPLPPPPPSPPHPSPPSLPAAPHHPFTRSPLHLFTPPPHQHASGDCRAHGSQQADQPPCDDGV